MRWDFVYEAAAFENNKIVPSQKPMFVEDLCNNGRIFVFYPGFRVCLYKDMAQVGRQ